MHKCPHNEKTTYCPQCVLDTTGHQGRMLDQFSKRLDYIWKKSDHKHKQIILEAESKYPLASTQVLASFPVKDDLDINEYYAVIKTTVSHLSEFKKEYKQARIRYFDGSFIIYADI